MVSAMKTYNDVYHQLSEEQQTLLTTIVPDIVFGDNGNSPIDEKSFGAYVKRFVNAAQDDAERAARVDATRRLAQALRNLGVEVYGYYERRGQQDSAATRSAPAPANKADVSTPRRRGRPPRAQQAQAAVARTPQPAAAQPSTREASASYNYIVPIEEGVVRVTLERPLKPDDIAKINKALDIVVGVSM